MKQGLLVLLFLVSLNPLAFSKTPSWKLNTNDYELSMSYSGVVIIDGEEVKDTADRVAAWVGTELRGIAKPFYVEATGRYYFFLLVYSNGGTEEVTFSLYNADLDEEILLSNKETFNTDETEGSFSEPYVFYWGYNNNFTYYDLVGIHDSITIDTLNRQIDIRVYEVIDLTNLVTDFDFFGASSITIDGVEQESGVTTTDFSQPLEYTIITNSNDTITWAVELTVLVGLNDYEVDERLKFYPNPCKHTLTWNNNTNIKSYQIVDEQGQLVDSKTIPKGQKIVDVSQLKTGSYILTIIRENGTQYIQKIVKY